MDGNHAIRCAQPVLGFTGHLDPTQVVKSPGAQLEDQAAGPLCFRRQFQHAACFRRNGSSVETILTFAFVQQNGSRRGVNRHDSLLLIDEKPVRLRSQRLNSLHVSP